MTPALPRRGVLLGAAGLATGLAVGGTAGCTPSDPSSDPLLSAAAPGAPGDGTGLPEVRLTAADPRYAALTGGFNLRFTGTPAEVVVVSTPAQCVAAVQRAVADGRRVTVRSGGHCYEGFVSDNPGGVVLDVSGMRRVQRAPDGAFGLDSGCTNWDVYERLYKQAGVTLPAGSCYSVGLGGHVLGGGYGLLSRRDGLVVDHLTAVDVVVVDAAGTVELVHASAADPRTAELFWAHTGGGGGTFGVVVTYWFADPPRPPGTVELATTTWDWSAVDADAFAATLAAHGRWHEERSGPDDPARELFGLLALRHVSAGAFAMTTQASGTDPAALDDLLGVLAAAVPAAARPTTTRRVLPWLAATQTLNGSGANQRGKYKSAYHRRALPDAHARALHAALTDPGYRNPQALVQVDSYGGRVNAVDPTATAVPQRDSVLKLQYQTYWTDPADDELHLGWIRRCYEAVYAATGGVPVSDPDTDGCYVSYPDVDLVDWPTLYWGRSYPRLQAVKARWDPADRFRHAQSVRLP